MKKYFNLKELLPAIMHNKAHSIDLSNTTTNDYREAPASLPLEKLIVPLSPGATASSFYCITELPSSSESNRKLIVAAGQCLEVWDRETGLKLTSYDEHKGEIYTVAALTSNIFATAGQPEESINLWKIDYTNINQPQIIKLPFLIKLAHRNPGSNTYGGVRAFNGKLVVNNLGNSFIYVWDIEDILQGIDNNSRHKQIANEHVRGYSAVLVEPKRTYQVPKSTCCYATEMSNNGKSLVVSYGNGNGQGQIAIFDTENNHSSFIENAHAQEGYGLAFISNGQFASCFNDTQIFIWNPFTGQKIKTLEGHPGSSVWGIRSMQDGTLVSWSDESNSHLTIRFWDVNASSNQPFQEIGPLDVNENRIWDMKVLSNGDLISGGGNPYNSDLNASVNPRRLPLSRCIRLWQFLKHALELSDVKPILEVLKNNTSVKTLILNGVKLEDEGARYLVELLSQNHSVIALDIRNTGISLEGMRHLIEVIKVHSTLCFVEFSNNGLFPLISPQEQESLHKTLIANRRKLFDVKFLHQKFPKFNIKQIYQQLTEKWEQLASDCEEIRKELNLSLTENINNFQRKTTSPNALEFDIQMTQSVLAKIKDKSSPIVMNFAQHAQSVLQFHAAQADVIARVTAKQQSSGELDNLKHLLNQVTHEVGGLTMPHNMQHIDFVIATVKKVVSNLQNVNKVNLLSDMEKFANVAFGQVFKLAGINLNDVKAIGIQLKEIEKNGINLENLGKGIDVLGTVLNFAGVSPQFVNQIVTIGKAAITIGTSIGQIIGGAAVAGPIGAIAGAVGAIFSLFSGPSQEQKMLENLSKQMQQGFEGLSKQIKESTEALAKLFCDGLNQLAKGINTNFEVLHEKLDAYHRRTEQRFDVLENMIQETHLQTMKKFEEVIKGITELKKQGKNNTEILNELKIRVNRLNDNLGILFEAASLNDYNISLGNSNVFLENSWRTKTFDAAKATKLFTKFITYGESHVVSPTFLEPLVDGSATYLRDKIKEHGHERCINLLASYINFENRNLPNFKFWTRVVHNVIHFTNACIYLLPFSRESPSQMQEFIYSRRNAIERLKQEGKNVSQFLLRLRQDEKFFHQLCLNYRDATNSFLEKIRAQQHPITVADLKDELAAIDIAYDMLVIYLSLAFNNDFTDNGIFLSYLNRMVWTAGEFAELINQHLFTQDNKTVICETISKYVFHEISGLEMLIKAKVEQAQHMQQTDYAILDTALQELGILEEKLTHLSSESQPLPTNQAAGLAAPAKNHSPSMFGSPSQDNPSLPTKPTAGLGVPGGKYPSSMYKKVSPKKPDQSHNNEGQFQAKNFQPH